VSPQDKHIELLALNVENENFFLNIIKYHGNTNTLSMKRPPTVNCGRPLK
jgi:hypothetical protein